MWIQGRRMQSGALWMHQERFHSDAYVSMTMRHNHRQDQPKRKRLRTQETCSTMMRIDQINAVCQAEREHRVEINKMTPPKTTDSDYFKLDMCDTHYK